MKIFGTISKPFRIVGFLEVPLPARLKKYPINTFQKSVWTIVALFNIITMVWFGFFEAKSIEQFAESLVNIAATCSLASCYFVFLWMKFEILKLITDLETIIENSEFCEF